LFSYFSFCCVADETVSGGHYLVQRVLGNADSEFCWLLTVSTQKLSEKVLPSSDNNTDSEAAETVLEVMYDAELDVYYDPKTLKYYKLKMPNDPRC
jgi:hypothetical protein